MHVETTIRLAARTDKGRVRDGNEDNFIVGADIQARNWKFSDYMIAGGEKGCLLAVADGMGGASAGEVASRIAIETVQTYFDHLVDGCQRLEVINEHLVRAVNNAHDAIVRHVQTNPEDNGMGTTMILVWVIGATAYICWSGDSRCYCYNNLGKVELLTDDHSVVWEMVLNGHLTRQQAAEHRDRNIITQSLGAVSSRPKPDFRIYDMVQGDRLLLCSDGLNGMLADEEIKTVIEKNPQIISNCSDLVEAANAAGGEDNITVVMYELVEIVSAKKSVSTRKNLGEARRHRPQTRQFSYRWVGVLLAALAIMALLLLVAVRIQ